MSRETLTLKSALARRAERCGYAMARTASGGFMLRKGSRSLHFVDKLAVDSWLSKCQTPRAEGMNAQAQRGEAAS